MIESLFCSDPASFRERNSDFIRVFDQKIITFDRPLSRTSASLQNNRVT
jgi:hypothetical protein